MKEVRLMLRSLKSTILGITLILIISFILPGCYTQLSRPRVDTEDEYYKKSEYEEVDEYYQDEGTLTEEKQDVYINNYFPSYWGGYYDYWDYFPYYWRYMGPYPHYWWDPYGHWWMPGWYVGLYYHNYGWGGYPRYYDSYYYDNGYYTKYSKRNFGRRPFTRRSIRTVEREKRIDSQRSLASPSRVERAGTTLSTPSVRDGSSSPDRNQRTVKEMVSRRLRSGTKIPKVIDNDRSRTLTNKHSNVRQPKTVKKPPRSSKSYSQPKIIEQVGAKSKPSTSKKSFSSPRRSDQNYSGSRSRSSNTRISKPSTRSYKPRSSSSSRSTTRSSPSRSSRSSSSKSSGSSKSSKK